jgi:precorrin-2 methylase
MPELNITGELTVEEIHKIREYNYEMTKNMTREDRRAYYDKGAERVLKRMQSLKNKPLS